MKEILVQKSTIPPQSLLRSTPNNYDYLDSFESQLADPKQNLNAEDLATAFFLSEPGWVDKLLKFRNKIARQLNLKTPGQIKHKEQYINEITWTPGIMIGLFKIFDITDNEIIMGEDDKHLNFRVSLFIASNQNQKLITISTTVQFNNLLGKLYFLPVQPFHKIIVPIMLKNMIRQLHKNKVNPIHF
ncbi:DUF2867 domain-containing protein [Niabella ginsengisoli]|uniref:DUF2867 domain-containing protein n=1 Tax=Niabella ginsengisoli TaxID=522298 RepID=A0ABS9SF98_9BACT|nr:DUF2867 domain-containing protein [Niabella ginsengisoli]MCH5597028.1 DUF2867 domain-containing protein [Niabella ginsengisoli]